MNRRVVLPLLATLALAAPSGAQRILRVGDGAALVRPSAAGGAVSRDGGASWIPLPPAPARIGWRSRSFDPLEGDPAVPAELRADDGNRLVYVQYVTDVVPEYGEALRALGAETLRYVPHRAHLARIDRGRFEELRARPWVRAVMEVELAHKLDPGVQADLLAGRLGRARYHVMAVDKRSDAARLEARVLELGGVLDEPAGGSIRIEATLTPEQLLALAREDTVLWIDPWGPPELHMDNLRVQAGVDYVEVAAGIDGKGIRIHVNEGIYHHPEFAARPPFRTDPVALLAFGGTVHGTRTAGTIFSQGLPEGVTGVLPYAQLLYSNRVQGQRYTLVQELSDPSEPYRALLMTQSWAGPRTAAYTSTSALLDDILFDFDHVFATQSQGNSGGTQGGPEAWAKNVVGVGGFLHGDNADPSDDCWCSTASTGPAQDGRVGVSFVAYYDEIRTVEGEAGYVNNFGGASGATPIVNGLAGAVVQMFTDGLFGYPAVAWQDRFGARPNLTTTRVLLTVGSRQLDFETGADRFQQGWGLPNLADLYDDRDRILVLDEEDVLEQGDSVDYWVWVPPGTPELRASMHHLEDEAVPSAIPTRINSLDLSVTDPAGNVYWGNGDGILAGPWSAPGGSPNDVDVHENVFVESPAAGTYRVRVAAPAVRADSHVETAAVDADFALAVRGIGGGRDRSGLVLDLESGAPGEYDVSLTGVPATGWSTGYTVFSLDTSRHPALGRRYGLETDALSRKILDMAPGPGKVFAFTPSTDPTAYPNATFRFPAPVAALVQRRTMDAAVALFDAQGDLVALSNVDRVTVQ